MSFLFGSAPSVSTFTPTPVSSLDPQQSLIEQLLGAQFGGGANSIFPQGYGGQLSAPLSGLQGTSLASLEAALSPSAGAAGQTGGAQSQAISTLEGFTNAPPVDTKAMYNSSVLQPLQHTFETTTLPDVVSALGGSAGGPRSTAATTGVTEAANNFENTLANTTATLGYNTQMAANNQALTAAQALPGAAAAPIQTLLQTLQAGAVPQQTQQTADTAGLQQYLQQQGFSQQGIQDLLALLGTKTTTETQPVVSPGQSGLLSSVLGNTGLGNAVGSSLLSSGGGSGAASGVGSLLDFASSFFGG